MTTDQAREAFIEAWESMYSHIGEIVALATAAIPSHMLLCDGATYNRVDYPFLYAAINPAYHIDANTFRVPDMRGRVIMGAGQGTGLTARSVGDTIGEESHVLTTQEMPDHAHQYNEPDTTTISGYLGDTPAQVPWHSSGWTTARGSNQAHNNIQPSEIEYYAIVAR